MTNSLKARVQAMKQLGMELLNDEMKNGYVYWENYSGYSINDHELYSFVNLTETVEEELKYA